MAFNVALYTGSAVTISTTEISLTGGTSSIQTKTDNAVIAVWISIPAMIAGDQFEVALLEKVISGGTQRRQVIGELVGIPNDLIVSFAAFHLGVGWDLSLKKISGTDRAATWSVRSVSGSGLNTALYVLSGVTVSSTEYSVTNNSTSLAAQTTSGAMQLWVDLTNVAAGDHYEVAMLEKAISGGTQQRIILGDINGDAGQGPLFVSPAFVLGVGWDFTLKKISGTDRAFDASVRSST